MPVSQLARRQDLSIEYVEHCEERRRAVPHIVVGDTFGIPQAHRQHRLRSFQRLALALLVHAEHQRILRRAQIKADNIAQLLDKERGSRELEVLAEMRLQPQQLEVAMYARRRDRGFRCDRTHTPMRRAIDRFGVQRLTNQRGHTLVVDRARFARAQLIMQSAESMRD